MTRLMSLDANGRRLPRRLLMTAYGWNESGGGTILPRLVAKELVRRGWEVTVFHAGVPPTPSGRPYEVVEWEDDGVRLVGVHNRPHGLFDHGNPLRELDDPPISTAFSHVLDRAQPDVVHFHNLHNLGASLFDHTAARGLPAYFSTHNYWLICPRVYLMTGTGSICAGPGDGSACASCVGGHDSGPYRERLSGIRTRAERSLTRILAVSDAVRNTLLASGYPDDLIDVVRQAMPQDQAIWERTGRDRRPGRTGDVLTVGFVGSAYPHKGPQLLVQAAQKTKAPVRVRIIGEVPARFAEHLRALDRRGAVDFTGSFGAEDLPQLLSSLDAAALPSMWWDCAPLAATECRAARTPLIVPRLGGLPEVVRDDVDGLVFDGLDADDLARQLDRLAGEPGLLERLQAAIPEPKRFAGYVDELEAYYAGEHLGGASSSSSSSPQRSSPAVRWQGDHGLPTSLSIINDRVTERLDGPVQRIGTDLSPVDPPLAHVAHIEVRHQWPPDLGPPAAGRLAAIVPWEFGAIPRDWLPQMERNVDELWVPSEHVRAMYIAGGLDPERVVSIPNGVDLDLFAPADDSARPDASLRFLFVGGLIWRKGPDVLLNAWRKAFAGRDDVTLVFKDFGADGVYRNSDRGAIREYVASGTLPRVELLEAELSTEELVALYRSCDVLVHPYRGEGFAMPVLEAMACGLPVITTAGGPTDEFCPPEAGWRIRADRKVVEGQRVGHLETAGDVWVLEPDEADLIALLRAAAADPAERRRRGAAGRRAAEALSWDAVAARYQQRIEGLALRRGRLAGGDTKDPYPLEEDVDLRVLATPAWRGEDRLAELLADWQNATTPTTSACLYLVADPGIDGDPSELEGRVLAAAAAGGVDLDRCADINVLMEPLRPERDRRLHIAMDAYVPLHGACVGHEREAHTAGNAVIELGTGELAGLLAAHSARRAA